MKVNSIFKFLIIICISCFAIKSYGQYSCPKLVIEEFELLNKPQLVLKNDQIGLLSYLKPEHSYHPTLGTFCILENKIAKKTNFPVKMRLGSVDYVDKLENKRN